MWGGRKQKLLHVRNAKEYRNLCKIRDTRARKPQLSNTLLFFPFNKNTEAISQAGIEAIQANSPGLWRQGLGWGVGGEGSCTVPLESHASPLDPQEEAV